MEGRRACAALLLALAFLASASASSAKVSRVNRGHPEHAAGPVVGSSAAGRCTHVAARGAGNYGNNNSLTNVFFDIMPYLTCENSCRRLRLHRRRRTARALAVLSRWPARQKSHRRATWRLTGELCIGTSIDQIICQRLCSCRLSCPLGPHLPPHPLGTNMPLNHRLLYPNDPDRYIVCQADVILQPTSTAELAAEMKKLYAQVRARTGLGAPPAPGMLGNCEGRLVRGFLGQFKRVLQGCCDNSSVTLI